MVGAGRLERFEEPLGTPRPGHVCVEVLGCGVCHTDLGFLYGGVPTAVPGLRVLGYEIAGLVVGTERLVVVPSVSPCGECAACRRHRLTACRASRMPGNHEDGGFASHVEVPARWLCDLPALPLGLEPWQLAPVADALSAPYQAIRRARLGAGELALVVGAGGLGGFLVQLAAALGARAIALDVSAPRLARARAHGAAHALDVTGREARAVKKELVSWATDQRLEVDGWHIFECSGAPRGQELAFGLLTRGATLSVVGFFPEAVPLRLSNLMALDAEAYGNWGADPGLYPDIVAMCVSGRVRLADSVERFPLSEAPAVLAATHEGRMDRRAVLVPDA